MFGFAPLQFRFIDHDFEPLHDLAGEVSAIERAHHGTDRTQNHQPLHLPFFHQQGRFGQGGTVRDRGEAVNGFNGIHHPNPGPALMVNGFEAFGINPAPIAAIHGHKVFRAIGRQQIVIHKIPQAQVTVHDPEFPGLGIGHPFIHQGFLHGGQAFVTGGISQTEPAN